VTPGRTAGLHGIAGRRRLLACGIALALMAGAAPARGQEVGVSLAVAGVRGTYDASYRLSGLYLFASVDVTGGPFRLWASVPFIRSSATVDTVDPVTGATTTSETTNSGVGDPLVRVDVRLVNDRDRSLYVRAAAAVKPSLVDASSGLGTGKTDVAVGGSVFKGIGRTSIFADALYWKYGDPDGIDLQDAVVYSVGFGRIIGTGRWSSMVTVSGASKAIVAGSDAPMQLNLAALLSATRRQSLAMTLGIGLRGVTGGVSVSTNWRVAF
jgi:hypothetical protein